VATETSELPPGETERTAVVTTQTDGSESVATRSEGEG
jgi:hypothetical protein